MVQADRLPVFGAVSRVDVRPQLLRLAGDIPDDEISLQAR